MIGQVRFGIDVDLLIDRHPTSVMMGDNVSNRRIADFGESRVSKLSSQSVSEIRVLNHGHNESCIA